MYTRLGDSPSTSGLVVLNSISKMQMFFFFLLNITCSQFYLFGFLFYLFGVLHHFQHCTGHITTGSWKGRKPVHVVLSIYLDFNVAFNTLYGHVMTGGFMGRGNQYIQLVKVLYCKLPTNGKQRPAFPLEVGLGTKPLSQRWEVRVLPLCHRCPLLQSKNSAWLQITTNYKFIF